MLRRDRNVALLLLALTAVWSLALALTGTTDGFLFLAPAAVIFLPLLLGRYPGEETLARIARPAPSPNRARGLARAATRVWPRVFAALPRGGRLVAASLAKRPPPVRLLTA